MCWGQYFQYISRKQTVSREEADFRAAHLQPVRLRPAEVRWLAGTSVSAAPKKMFVCLNNYAPMFLISFLKSLESHYPVSGPSRTGFWETQYDRLLKAGVYIGGYSRLTFDISEESYQGKLAAYL